jgi:hypothetical protein
MSNDLITMMKNSPAAALMGIDEDTRAIMGGGSSNKRISIDGGVFRKYVGGKEVSAVEARYMNLIFVKFAPTFSRTYYVDAYKKGVKVSPACWSSDSRVPDSAVKSPQARSCDVCPHNVKGTGQGGQGTACRKSWRTAVVLPNDPSGDVMQLVIPAASVWGDSDGNKHRWEPYIKYIGANNMSVGRIVTRVAFDTNASSPKLWFSPVEMINVDDLDTIISQGKSEASQRAIKLTVFQVDEGKQPALEFSPAQPAPVVDVFAPVEEEEVAPEPVLRQESKPEAAPAADVSDVVKKWSKRK